MPAPAPGAEGFKQVIGMSRAAFPDLRITVEVSGIEIFRLRDGKVAEFWHADDLLGLMQQLGAIPEESEA